MTRGTRPRAASPAAGKGGRSPAGSRPIAPDAPPTGAALEHRFRLVPRSGGILAASLGGVCLVDRVLRSGGGLRLLPEEGAMALSTAASVVLLGLSLIVLGTSRSRPLRSLAAVAAAGVAVLGAFLGAGHLLGLELRIEELVADAVGVPPGGAGRMAPNTALALGLLGPALALFLSRSPRLQRAGEWMACGAAFLAFQALTGYGVGVQILYRLPEQAAMAIPTTLALLSLAAGILFLRPYQGLLRVIVDSSAAGVAGRSLLPMALAVPPGLAVVVALGVERGLYSERAALSLLATSVTLFTLFAVGWTVGEIRAVDRERRRLLDSERRARKEAEGALRAREELLAVVSHDLRNPLGTIHSTASLLLAGIPPQEEYPRYLGIIRRSSTLMERLIQDLLDVSRMEKGRLAVELRRADLVPVLRETCEGMEQSAAAEGITLCCRVPDDLPAVRADPDRIRQAVGNLLGNALKFTPRGGLVRLEAEDLPEGVCVRVADTGCGIPPEDQRHLFEPFWQAPGGEKRGVGLGLAIVRGIVEVHGGRVEVASAVGEGTTFSFTLPRAGGPSPPPERRGAGSRGEGLYAARR